MRIPVTTGSLVVVLCLGALVTAVPAPDVPTSPEADAVRELIRDGEYAEAEKDARALLAELEVTEGSDPLVIARVLDVLVEALMRGGKATDPETVAVAKRALDMRVELRGNDDSGTVNSLGNVAILMFYAGDYAAARPYFERVVESQARVLGPGHVDTARSTNNFALVLWRLGKYDEARALYEQVLPVIENAQGAGHPDVAAVLNNLGLILWETADYAGARSYLDRALEIRRGVLGDAHPDVALTLNNLGLVLRDAGDFATAWSYLEQAVESYERALGADHPDLARARVTLASVLVWLGQYDEARELYRLALDTRVRVLGPDHPDVADIRARLGSLELDAGDYEAAREHLEASLRIRETALGPEHPDVAYSLHELSRLLWALGDGEDARALDERALGIREKVLGEDHPSVALSLGYLATHSIDSDPARSLVLYRRSFEIQERTLGPEHPLTARVLGNMALAMQRIGDVEQARSILERVLEIQERTLGPEHVVVAGTLLELAEMPADPEQVEEELALCDRAGAILTQALGADAPSATEVLRVRSKLLFTGGNRDAARVEAERAAAMQGAQRREVIRLLPERQALAFAAMGGHPEAVLFSGLVASGDEPWLTAAWSWTLRDRGVVLDEVAARQHAASSQESAEAVEAWRALAEARQHLAALWVRGPGADDPEDYGARLASARERKESAERALAKAGSSYRAQPTVPFMDLDSIRAVLPEGGALVEIVRVGVWSADAPTAPDHDVALILNSEKSASFVDLGPSAEIDDLVRRWRRALEESAVGLTSGVVDPAAMEALDEAGTRLREIAWDPVFERVRSATTIFLVPDGSLHLVDFGALPTGKGRFVADSSPGLQLLGTGRDLLRFASVPRGARARGVLVVGNPDFGITSRSSTRGSVPECVLGLGWLALPESDKEARQIAEMFAEREPARVLSGSTADEATFKLEAPGKRVIHLATHGFFLEESCAPATPGGISDSPLLLSGLALAGANRARDAGRSEDGILTAEELAALDLDGVELVVLSACETGRGSVLTGQGVQGMRRALEIAGVRSVVMSLWPVPDRAVRRFMASMYEAWLDGAPVSEAARQASLASLARLRERHEPTHPYLWSGFVTAGDWR